MATVRTSYEQPRGCGYRQAGGLYLVCDGPARRCGRLPVELEACPVCGSGIKPSRGWTWIRAAELFQALEKAGSLGSCNLPKRECKGCPVGAPPERAGLIWVGEKYYKCPGAFMREAVRLGISRRIAAVPNGLVVGETVVFLAHRITLIDPQPDAKIVSEQPAQTARPAIFSSFVPSRIEYIITGQETAEELDRLEARGFSLVDVKPVQQTLTDIN